MRKKIVIDRADRLFQMPQSPGDYYPKEIKTLIPKNRSIIDLGRPVWGQTRDTEGKERESLAQSISNGSQKEASAKSLQALQQSIADWAGAELDARVDPDKEVFVGSGVRNLLTLAALAFLDPGDIALYPNPGYPIYRQVCTIFGAEPIGYALTAKRSFKPRMKQFTERVGKAAKAFFLNNPHNPSGAGLDSDEMDEILWMAARDNTLILNDAAYYSYSNSDNTTLFCSPGGRKVGLEFYSVSLLTAEPANPLGFALGSKDLISGLKAASEVFRTRPQENWTKHATALLSEYPGKSVNATSSRIRETWPEALRFCEELGLEPVNSSQEFPYLFARIPSRASSRSYAATLLRKYGLISLPGIAFGDMGEGYIRLTATVGPLHYQEAVARLKEKGLRTG